MDNSSKQVIMGPPAPMTTTSNQSKPGNPTSAPPPHATKSAAAPPKRIIKKIQLDFNKLKEAGLDRQLAEVLRKQKLDAKRVDAPSSTSLSTSAAAQSTPAAPESKLQSPQQQLRQPAPQPLVKRFMISEHIEKIVPIQTTPNPTDGDRSKQVKALLKNRILNKSLVTNTQPQQKPTTSKAAPKMTPPVGHDTAARSGGIFPASAASSVSIAKADLTVRQKQPPLLLNLVNQLPKHRAMCVSSNSPLVNPHGHQVSPSPQRIPVQQTPNAFSQPHPPSEVPIARAAPAVPAQLHRSPTPPLIVLEHKVLAPNEKIDLSGLRLPNATVEATSSPDSAATPNIQSKVIKGKVIMSANKFKVSREKLAEMAKEIRNQADQVKQPQAMKTLNSKDVISTIDTPFTVNTILQPKRTSPFSSPTLKGNIAPLYNPKPNKTTDFSAGSSIRLNPLPVESTKQTIESNESTEDTAIDFPTSVPTTPGNRYSSEPNQNTSNSKEPEFVSNSETEGVKAVANPLDFPVYIPSTPEPTTESSPLKSFNEPINYPEVNALGSSTPVYIPLTSETGHLTANLTESDLVHLPEPENKTKDMHDLVPSVPSTSKLNREPNTEIDDMHFQADTSAVSKEQSSSSAATSPELKIQSAVDFIAQLTAENPLDESSFMDLSPEEQRLNALFGFGGCSFDSASVPQPEEEELPIGKIVKMDDMNILHATLDISSDSTNVLRISPNAVKMQSSVTSLNTPLVDLEVGDSALEDSNIHINDSNPVDTTASELQNVNSSVAETPIQEAKDETTVITNLPEKSDEKSQVPLEEVKTASDPEPLKEVNPPVKRAPIRSKRAKINLVQRTKRPSMPKPIEVKKAKLDFEEEDEQAMDIDHSLMEDRYGVAGIEVPADEKQCEEEISPVQDEDSAKSQAHENKDDESEISYQKEDKIQSKSSSERDLTQLYHPPKMPKNKSTHKTSSQDTFEDPQPASSSSNVSLIDVLSQNPPAPQGEPQLPFRKDLKELNTSADSSVDAKGIQNLIGHLTAEKVVPQTKKLSPTSKSEEGSKALPRKKLVKTRPVLSKRSTKVGQKNPTEKPAHFEFLHPVSANAGNRVPTSSTSDDDGSIFLGFDDNEGKRSKTPVRSQRVKQMKINETDISDDATPDYDETEEEQPSIVIQQPVKSSAADSKFTFDRHKVVEAFSDDSDSSDAGPSSPMDFGDNMSIDDGRTSEECSKEDGTAWAKLVNENAKPSADEVLSPSKSAIEATVDCSRIDDPPKTDGNANPCHHRVTSPFCASSESECVTDEKQPEPVIKENESITLDRKSQKNRRKPTKSISMATDEPVEDSSTASPLKTPGSSENADMQLLEEGNASDKQNAHLKSPEALTNQKNAKLKKNLEEVYPEKPLSSLRSRGKRKSGSHNKKLDDPEEPPENISCTKKEEEATEKDLEDGERLKTVDTTEDTDSTRNPIDNITAEKAATKAKRKSRCIVSKDSKKEMEDIEAPEDGVKSSKDDLPPTLGDAVNSSKKPEDQKPVDVPEVSVKSKETRKSLRASLNNKVPGIQPEPVINPISSSENSTPRMEEDMTDDAKNNRHTRNKSPQIKGSPTIKHSESIESQVIKGSDASSKAESSIRPTRQRQSRYSTAKSEPKAPADSKSKKVSEPSISTVTQDLGEAKPDSSEKTSGDVQLNSCKEQEVCKDSNQAKDSPKSRKKRQSQSQPKPDLNPDKLPAQNRDESVQAPKEQLYPTTSKNSRGKRQSRLGAPTNTPATMLATASEDPEPVEGDSVVVHIKQKTSTRRGSVPRDTPISSVNASDESVVLESVPKKGRRSNISSVPADTTTPKSSKSGPLNASEMIPLICEEPKVPSRRGRKRAAPSDLEPGSAKKLKTEESSETERVVDFNLRLLLIRKRDQLDNLTEVLTDDGKGQGPLHCGLCLARSDKNNWQRHIGEHYGVGWLMGETPKNITRSGIMTMMKNYLQKNGGKLTCRLCNQQLGSYLGMMLHLEGCGNKQRFQCEFCQRSYTKLSLPVHIRTCPKRIAPQVTADPEDADEDVKETVFSNAGRAKRKSTIKAETKLKKIGEALTTQKSGEGASAKNDFDGDSSDYDLTKDKESSEEYDSEGVDSNEDSISSEGEGSLGDNFSTSKHSKGNRRGDIDRKRICNRPVNVGECQQKPLLSRYHHLEARATHKWNEFVQRNYEAGILFPQLVPSYSKIPEKNADGLLPPKNTPSMRYSYGKVKNEDDWKQLAPFEGFNKEGEYVGYLGSSIKKLEWVPLPPKAASQYLLCSVRSKMKTFARHNKLKDEDGLLMLLKCTAKNAGKSWTLRPELHYAVHVPNGPIHSFSFLPSGGYDKSSNRLGVLAVANSLSSVHIYALPLELANDENDENADEKVVIQLDSLITLTLDINNPVQNQCTKICWSLSSGHSFLATGYSSGHFALWDIGEKDNLNCFTRNNQTHFVPVNFLYIGERNVQYMDLHYDNNGPRWLAVGTSIRQFKIYDIANWSNPYILTQDTISSLYMANLTWSPICEALVVSSSHFFRTIAVSPSGIQFEHRTLDGTLTTTREMHTNCQQNHMVFVTDNGDLVFLDVRNLNCGPALLKSTVNSRAVSTTELHHLGSSAPNATDPIGPDKFLRDYGLQINPLVPEPHKRKSTYLSAKRRPQNIHSLALTRFNCVRCNWNSPTHTWVAMGAEHGMLRILNFDRDKFF
ncbi:mucin-17 isoform X2 [Drosophila mauritiana]|uniref:Mucin-17 isoform X2 n=1 Tax=Drosophila mauritiana TaxID=7226 RepID=A0A6P8JYQ9_DROMA|nr:mucin-17 isoform X2 [Drosophila mauritiana]